MTTVVTCPTCARRLQLPADLMGRMVKCAHCGGMFEAKETPPPLDSNVTTKQWSRDDAPPPSDRNDNELADLEDDKAPCPRCRYPNRIGEARCRRCGEELDDPEDDRPWERGLRRDSEPHRGPTILALGIISIVCSPIVPCCGVPGIIFGIVGLGVGIPAWVMGSRDLKKMDAGLMDPRGRANTKSGWICGIVGTSLNALGILLAVAIQVAAWTYFLTTMPAASPAGGGGGGRKMFVAPEPRLHVTSVQAILDGLNIRPSSNE